MFIHLLTLVIILSFYVRQIGRYTVFRVNNKNPLGKQKTFSLYYEKEKTRGASRETSNKKKTGHILIVFFSFQNV